MPAWLFRSTGGVLLSLLLSFAGGLGLRSPAVLARDTPRADALQAIRQVWPQEHLGSAIRLAHLESGLTPTARGCGGDCFGLFQINFSANRGLIAAMGIRSPEQLLDPLVNSSVAYAIFRQSGWEPWGIEP